MEVCECLINEYDKLAIIGLGYVGLPLVAAFSKKMNVIGYDIDVKKVDLLNSGIDYTGEIGGDDLKRLKVTFTSKMEDLTGVKFFIVTVPTPIHKDHTPDLGAVVSACEVIGTKIQIGSVIVFESTVYPGVTENVCMPILERVSGYKCGKDFKIGYSPERINPGDKIHRLHNIKKIVSGIDSDALVVIKELYDSIIEVGTYPVSSIKVAEAIKVAENSQRDINIAFMNELSMIFDRMDIDSREVLNGMNTKWNALGFQAGLVGGHCIGIDPYYFIYEAERFGYHSQIMLNGRIVNDNMGCYVADKAVKLMIREGMTPKFSRVIIGGLTFKENCSDVRNSKVADIYERLREYEISPIVLDPWADSEIAERDYGINLYDIDIYEKCDCLIVAVSHDTFKEINLSKLKTKILIDVKSIYDKKEVEKNGMIYWSL